MHGAAYRSAIHAKVFTPGEVALEEEKTDGKAAKEIEYMFYARLEDIAALQQSKSVEIQEQWGLWYDKSEKTAGTGSIRVRKIIPKGLLTDGQLGTIRSPTQYVQTIKIKDKNGDSIEVPSESSSAGFKAFKIIADSGMLKHRYRFEIPESGPKAYYLPGATEPSFYSGTNLTWEVDMFLKPGASIDSTDYMPWCKIDLEVPNRDIQIPPFPEGFLDAFDSKDPNLTEEQKRVIADMKKFLSLPNVVVEKFYPDL